MSVRVETIKGEGVFPENSYVYINEKTLEAVIIDPGEDISAAVPLGIKPVAILLTHGHYDHTLYANFTKTKYKINIYAHELETGMLKIPVRLKNGEKDVITADCLFKDRDTLFGLRVIHTPGHTPGCSCFYDAENGVLFSGDALFRDPACMDAIKQRLLLLPEETVVYPGHNAPTTIKHEKEGFYAAYNENLRR
ncbi:MBL fold hydrolase [Clostridia bacterium]|nr:MBL fold hydrolase [Clostridia bacterium]